MNLDEMSPHSPKALNALWVGIGSMSLALGFIGIFLPVMPTTPFVLLAAFCFARGSPRLHDWLVNHPKFGPPIRDWENGHVIRTRTKIIATVTMVVSMSFPLFIIQAVPMAARIAMAIIGAAVLVFIWMQKSEPAPSSDRTESRP
jgi:uncharacterized membrane protein YbaN (DUF454 family)